MTLLPGILLGDVRDRTIVVSQRAAEEYGDHCEIGVEEARRELTRYLREARVTHAAVDSTPALARYRNRSSGVDLSARVADDGELLVVVAVRVRGYAPRRGGAE